MKRHIVRVLIAVLSFLIGLGVSRLVSSKESTVKELPELEVYSPTSTTVFAVTTPQPVLPVPAPAAVTDPFVVMDFNWKQFDPNGHYTLGDRKPRPFAEVDGFSLDSWEDNNKVLSGGLDLVLNINGEYLAPPTRMAWVTRDRILFATVASDEEDFEYRFDGRFLRSGVIAMARPGTVVLEGTLTKFKGGKKVAEKVVKFQVEELHGC